MLKILKFYGKIGKLPSMFINFFIVAVGWVFFRVEKISDAFIYIKKMFRFNFENSHLSAFQPEFYTYFFIAIFFAFFVYFKQGQKIQDSVYFNVYSDRRHVLISSVSVILLLLCIASITTFGFNPFIYFRF